MKETQEMLETERVCYLKKQSVKPITILQQLQKDLNLSQPEQILPSVRKL
jgi:hypothetical protein